VINRPITLLIFDYPINWSLTCLVFYKVVCFVFNFSNIFVSVFSLLKPKQTKMNKTGSTICLVLLHIYLSIVLTISAPESAIVTQVPGFNGTIPSKHHAG
jgi:hypothetical protein